MKHRYTLLFLIPALLLAGVFVYAGARPENLFINQFLKSLPIQGMLAGLREFFQNLEAPAWVIYSLPDALWMLALVLVVLTIWDFNLNCRSILWIGFALITGVSFEILQVFQVVPGTFDILDLMVILIAAFLPLSFIIIKTTLCITK